MSTLITPHIADGVATLTLNRPPVNAFNTDCYVEIRDTIRTVGDRSDVNVIVIRSGIPAVFSGGADLRDLDATLDKEGADAYRQQVAWEAFEALRTSAVPTICALNGPTVGAGAVIAVCCDIRYASTRFSMKMTEINIARAGGGRHLMRVLPQGKVREMYFTGRPIHADEALALGAVQRVVEPDELEVAVQALAAEIASKSPLAVRVAKRSLDACEFQPLPEGYATEQQHTLVLSDSDDAREATRAFIEKREPVWTGR